MLIEKILKTILEAGIATTDIILSGYNESYRKMRGLPPRFEKIDYEKIKTRRFYSLLSKLQREGFIKKEKNKTTNRSIWSITKKGKERINKTVIRNQMPQISPISKKDFLKIIIFDIPELNRKKRNWLRRTLVNLGFEKLQKSVWIGEEQLPKDFLYHINELKLVPYIHIFEVSKRGSLTQEI